MRFLFHKSLFLKIKINPLLFITPPFKSHYLQVQCSLLQNSILRNTHGSLMQASQPECLYLKTYFLLHSVISMLIQAYHVLLILTVDCGLVGFTLVSCLTLSLWVTVIIQRAFRVRVLFKIKFRCMMIDEFNNVFRQIGSHLPNDFTCLWIPNS